MAVFRSVSKLLPLIAKLSGHKLLRNIARLLLAFLLGYGVLMPQRTAVAQPALEYQVNRFYLQLPGIYTVA